MKIEKDMNSKYPSGALNRRLISVILILSFLVLFFSCSNTNGQYISLVEESGDSAFFLTESGHVSKPKIVNTCSMALSGYSFAIVQPIKVTDPIFYDCDIEEHRTVPYRSSTQEIEFNISTTLTDDLNGMTDIKALATSGKLLYPWDTEGVYLVGLRSDGPEWFVLDIYPIQLKRIGSKDGISAVSNENYVMTIPDYVPDLGEEIKNNSRDISTCYAREEDYPFQPMSDEVFRNWMRTNQCSEPQEPSPDTSQPLPGDDTYQP